MDENTVLDKKRDFTIRCTAADGIIIEDGNHKKGGNLRSKGGKKIAWTNSTARPTCYLKFTILAGDDMTDDGAATWPFEGSAPADKLLALPRDVRTEQTLVRVTGVQCMEYAVLDEHRQELLDPVIIIEQ